MLTKQAQIDFLVEYFTTSSRLKNKFRKEGMESAFKSLLNTHGQGRLFPDVTLRDFENAFKQKEQSEAPDVEVSHDGDNLIIVIPKAMLNGALGTKKTKKQQFLVQVPASGEKKEKKVNISKGARTWLSALSKLVAHTGINDRAFIHKTLVDKYGPFKTLEDKTAAAEAVLRGEKEL